MQRRFVVMVLDNGSAVVENVTEVAEYMTDEEVLEFTEAFLETNRFMDNQFVVFGQSLVNTTKIVEVYVTRRF